MIAEMQVQEIVTLDSTDIQEEIQLESEPAPCKEVASTEEISGSACRHLKGIGDTSCNHSLRFANKCSSEW